MIINIVYNFFPSIFFSFFVMQQSVQIHDEKICPVESLICIQNKQTKCLKQVLFYGLMIYFSYIDYVYRNVLIVYPFFN